jgi:integrase
MTKRTLTQTAVDELTPEPHPRKWSFGGGLHILVTPNGSKLWRLSYRIVEPQPDGSPVVKQKTLALGAYHPETNSVEHAKLELAKAKLALKEGRDPGRQARVVTGGDTFEKAARAWHNENAPDWSPKYSGIVLKRLEDHIFPTIGGLPMASIHQSDVKQLVADVKAKGLRDTARRAQQYIGAVFRNSDDESLKDPTAKLRTKRKGKQQKKVEVQRHHKRLKREEIGEFLLKLNESACEPETRLAMRLTILTAARTSEILGARWDEFESLRRPKQALWRIPGERMKEGLEHVVPLSTQAQAVLDELRKRTGKGAHLFPSRDGYGVMSNNTMLFHAYAMGYRNKTTMHGFRGSFSTIAHEATEPAWPHAAIELCLAHSIGNSVSRVYNSAELLPKRRELLQWWADELDALNKAARTWRRING